MTETLISVAELAEILGVHHETVYRRTADGLIPGYRVGAQYRYDLQEVLDSMRLDPEVVDDEL